MNQFFAGVLATLCVIASVFFWTFWRRTRDTLFRAFSAGFAALGLHWAGLGILNPSDEVRHYLFMVRFFAFALIIWGVVVKNRRPSGPSVPGPSVAGTTSRRGRIATGAGGTGGR